MVGIAAEKKINALTFVRFLAALIVVFFHFGQKTWLARVASPLITSGPQMVSLFFVLSGFVLTISHFHREKENPLDFYVARLARIFPAYFIALILSYLFFNTNSLVNGPLGLVLSLTFLQSWIPRFPLTLNSPGWSLSIEVFFYLTFPFILFWIKKRKASWKTVLVTSIVFYLVTQVILTYFLNSKFYGGEPSISYDLIYYFPLSHLSSFILGIAGGLYYLSNPASSQQPGIFPLVFLIGTLGLNYFLLQYPQVLNGLTGLLFPFRSSFYAPFFLSLILALAFSKNALINLISRPLLVLLGEASYSLYILQLPVYSLYTTILTKLFHGLILVELNIQFYVYLLILVGLSILSFLYIEKPCKKWILKLYSRVTIKPTNEIPEQ